MIYKSFVKPLLFRLDPEVAHNLMVRVCSILWQFRLGRALSRFIFSRKTAFSTRSTNLAGLKLKNPIGLAAGFDKSGELAIGLETLGFGFIEIGTVTPRPQAGNPKPRLFRDPVNLALINRMGFNNDGAIVVAERLRRSKKFISIPVGVNIGKNKDTPIERAVEDYRECARAFRGLADYLTVNISSPNTPGLRDLQNVAFLTELATSLNAEQLGCPVFLKLAPEVTGEALRSICQFLEKNSFFSGLILTNTLAGAQGGVSGAPLNRRSESCLIEAKGYLPAGYPLVSVGGIYSQEQMNLRLKSGACAVQLYTSMIFEGPGLVSRLVRTLNNS